jgi:CHAT domain-containing protein
MMRSPPWFAVVRFNVADASLVKAVGRAPNKRDTRAEGRLRAEMEQLDKTITATDARLAETFPDYTALANPLPLALGEAQGLLASDEALVAWLLGSSKGMLWVVRDGDAKAYVLDVKAADIRDSVQALRQALDPVGVARIEDLPRFPVAQAQKLYQQIFAPAEQLLQGVRRVFVVPNGALQSLPAGVLVTGVPAKPVTEVEDYRDIPWLAKRYAVTVLPSVRSLKALRVFASRTAAKRPFVGFGDPELDGAPGGGRANLALALYQRGSLADVSKVRELPQLPETADELRALATSLGGSAEDLFLGPRATEPAVKTANLAQYRVLAFATHGLTAGDFAEVGEPALVMTPPPTATSGDDGLLTAGEVARLKLNADWVVLSACNTAAPDGTPGAEGLSGLARAFFYAGSRALLVSHWPVDSQAATRLTTRLFSIAVAEPALGRAEALQRSMLELMASPDRPYYAHPLFWAPFVVVGEGGTARNE